MKSKEKEKTFEERQKLNSQNKEYLMPIIQRNDKSFLTNCKYKSKYTLTDDDKKIRSSYAGFIFNELAKFVREIRATTIDSWGYHDITFFHNTLYGKIPTLNINFFSA